MVYLIFVVIAALTVVAIEVHSARRGVLDFGKLNIYKKCDDNIVPFRGASWMLITIICFALSVALQVSLYKNTSTINFVKLYGVFCLVVPAAIVDFKRRIIPNELILAGLIFRAGLYAYEIFSHAVIKDIIINDLIGLAIGFGILAIVSLITRGAVGFGDAKLFGIIGLISGSFCTYSTLLISLVLSAIVSIIGLARKKIGRKDAIPFGPCIAIGYTLALLLTSY